MLVYHASKENFQEDVLGGKIADIVKEKLLEHGINDQNPAEFNAWTNSLMFMRMALENQAIPSEAQRGDGAIRISPHIHKGCPTKELNKSHCNKGADNALVRLAV